MAKILIVDDELGMVMVIKGFLEKNNYEIVTASDGKEGLAKAQNEKPDLILLDIMMPNMDGGDVIRALKSDSLTRNIPVIFLSAFVYFFFDKCLSSFNSSSPSKTSKAAPLIIPLSSP